MAEGEKSFWSPWFLRTQSQKLAALPCLLIFTKRHKTLNVSLEPEGTRQLHVPNPGIPIHVLPTWWGDGSSHRRASTWPAASWIPLCRCSNTPRRVLTPPVVPAHRWKPIIWAADHPGKWDLWKYKVHSVKLILLPVKAQRGETWSWKSLLQSRRGTWASHLAPRPVCTNRRWTITRKAQKEKLLTRHCLHILKLSPLILLQL